MKRNPYPFIIPCHRVIKSDGSPGGYIFGKRKKKLLKLEQKFLKDCF
ncbi:MAG: MGMT family protein [Candidatus Omnitrophica bacterium]|nr:MGMT family protein [Candidatus Omnitrophota bacterium]